jgi:hypothetical protein
MALLIADKLDLFLKESKILWLCFLRNSAFQIMTGHVGYMRY